jgi:hypothetical protein
MDRERFVPVAGALGVKIHAPENSCVSFCNSPFPAHRDYGALDIYPADAKFNDEVACPVNGIVKEVRRFSSPSLFPDKPPIYEYLTLIESDENPSVFVKIIHACPKVSVGDRVSVGEKIAVLIHSGYYPFWVDPHIHVELRNPKDPVRAAGSYNLGVLNAGNSEEGNSKVPNEVGIDGVVKKIEKRYVIVQPNPEHWMKVGIFSGLRVTTGKGAGILDGGIPFMGYAGVIAGQNITTGSQVYMGGTSIGEVNESLNGLTKLNTVAFKIIVGGLEYLGFSGNLCLGDTPQFKLIPMKTGQINLHVGETITIKKS